MRMGEELAADRAYGPNSNSWLNKAQQRQALAPLSYSNFVEENRSRGTMGCRGILNHLLLR